MSDKEPLVSVFMPVYNAGDYLIEAIESILNQTYTNFEFVILNDGSTDHSESIIKSFSDSRIRFENNEKNIGLIASLNKGLTLCKGKYIARMDQDDISLPTRLEKQITWMESHPEYGLIGCWFEDFGDQIESKVVRYSSDDNYIRIRHLYQTHISHPTAVFRTEVIRKYQLSFDPEFVHGEDYNFWVSLSSHALLSNYEEVLVRKRDHPRSITNQFASIMHATCTRVKQRQFEAMGAPLSVEEADLYTRFADTEWSFTEIEMNRLAEIVSRILIANRTSSFIHVDSFEDYLAEKWFHLCYQNKNIRIKSQNYLRKVIFKSGFKPSFLTSFRMFLRSFRLPV
jgi:glycosyltransferase involved in cell wall biosynthesis